MKIQFDTPDSCKNATFFKENGVSFLLFPRILNYHGNSLPAAIYRSYHSSPCLTFLITALLTSSLPFLMLSSLVSNLHNSKQLFTISKELPFFFNAFDILSTYNIKTPFHYGSGLLILLYIINRFFYFRKLHC